MVSSNASTGSESGAVGEGGDNGAANIVQQLANDIAGGTHSSGRWCSGVV